MTLNQRIIEALSPLGLPVVPDVDTLHRDRCFVFHYDSGPTMYADDMPWMYTYQIQVHLFLPLGENSLAMVDKAVRALTVAGFSAPEVTDSTDESGQHKVLSCEAAAIEEEGESVWLSG